MNNTKVIVSLPTDDLEKAYQFYLHGMGFTLAREMPDGSRPEPVVFQMNTGMQLMLVPRDGFAFVTPTNTIAAPGSSECVLTLDVASADEVQSMANVAKDAGATIVSEPAQQPWGYAAQFKDLDQHLWMVVYTGQ